MGPKKVNVSVVTAVSDRTHMLDRSEMYLPEKTVGPCTGIVLTRDMKLAKVETRVNPALIHLPLEGISNAADNSNVNGLIEKLTESLKGKKPQQIEKLCRNSPARVLVELTPERMAVENYGAPFPIDYLRREGKQLLIPYACVAIPKVGSNFDASKPRIGTGRYGCGMKTIPTCSRKFQLECVDAIRHRYYFLQWEDNADPAKIHQKIWPTPQRRITADDSEELYIPDSDLSAIPDALREKFARGSYTRVEWWPDLEIGDLTQEHVTEFAKLCTVGDIVRVRRSNGGESEELCTSVVSVTANDVVIEPSRHISLAKTSHLRHLSNATKNITVPGTRLFFRGSLSITDDEINLTARYAMDFTLCGVPIILRRKWADGQTAENLLCPTTILDYGKLLFGDTVNCHLITWQSNDSKAPVTCNAAYFDTPHAGEQLGYVNGVCTQASGIHINAACNAFFGPIKHASAIQKYASSATLADMKRHISVLVMCVGSDPSQKGQTKEGLGEISGRKSFTMPPISPEDAEKMVKQWEGFRQVMEKGKSVEIGELREKIKKSPIHAYIPANTFGIESALVLAEGDSCLTYAGVAKNMHPRCDSIGILSMRGVPPNLYESDCSRMLSNRLFGAIVNVMNIDPLKQYETEAELATLKYGSIVFMGDPDLDGFHIVALMLADLYHYWPFLFRQRRVGALRTPVMRIWNPAGTQVLARYYSDEEYDRAVKNGEAPKGDAKRIKGLGSVECGSLDEPGVEIHDDIAHAPVMWFSLDKLGAEALHRFFAKGLSMCRKADITQFAIDCLDMTGVCSPSEQTNVMRLTKPQLLQRPVETYIRKELIQYSLGSLVRQIPDMRDGLKDVQRKYVMWWLVHHNYGKTNDRLKVESMAGRVTSEFDYHHGQPSLGGAIKRMAIVGFPGANNVPFFKPRSGMGSRINWPVDCPQDRYAMVSGAGWLSYAYKKYVIEAIPRMMSDEGPIEPAWIPCVIPFTLMNGIFGVATGWRTYVPPCHPTTVFNFLRELATAEIEGREARPSGIIFWYIGFKGSIEIKRGVMATLRKKDFNEDDGQPEDNDDSGPNESHTHESPNNEGRAPEDPEEEPMYVEKGIEFKGLYTCVEPARPGHGPNGTVKILRITEIPPELRLEKLNLAIQKLEKDGHVTWMKHSTKSGIYYEIGLTQSGFDLGRAGQIEKILGLRATYPLTNIFFLNEYGAPIKYNSVEDYLRAFYANVITAYAAGIRKQIAEMMAKVERVKMAIRFIQSCIEGFIRLGEMKRSQIISCAASINVDEETIKSVKSYDANEEGLADYNVDLDKLNNELTRLRSLRPCAVYLDDLDKLEKHVPTCPLPVQTGPFSWAAAATKK